MRSNSARDDFRADLRRYHEDPWISGALWWISERTIWAVAAYRLGQWIGGPRKNLRMRAVRPLYNLIYPFVQALTGIEIWPETQIGPGLRIYHGGNIVINPATRVGANCVLRQGVTLGVLGIGQTDCPTIGDGVEFGAYVQVLGGVTIGAGAKVGAMSVVLADVPPGKTAVGAPARVID